VVAEGRDNNPFAETSGHHPGAVWAQKEKPARGRLLSICLILERETRLELATPTLARWLAGVQKPSRWPLILNLFFLKQALTKFIYMPYQTA
jgi:hypothetical protein